MSWSIAWEGKASDALEMHFPVRGVPGPTCRIACGAIWESLQAIAQTKPGAYAKVLANGTETPGELGRFTVTVEVGNEPSEIEARLKSQQPVDQIPTSGSDSASTASEPAQSSVG